MSQIRTGAAIGGAGIALVVGYIWYRRNQGTVTQSPDPVAPSGGTTTTVVTGPSASTAKRRRRTRGSGTDDGGADTSNGQSETSTSSLGSIDTDGDGMFEDLDGDGDLDMDDSDWFTDNLDRIRSLDDPSGYNYSTGDWSQGVDIHDVQAHYKEHMERMEEAHGD